MSNKSIFSEFTNLYSLTKTLRFELKPTDETKKYLEKTNLDPDRKLDYSYQALKPFLDKLHRDFTNEALETVDLDLKEYFEKYKIWKSKGGTIEDNENGIEKKSKTKKSSFSVEFKSENTNLRNNIFGFLNINAHRWYEKYSISIENLGFKAPENGKKKTIAMLSEKGVLDLLKHWNLKQYLFYKDLDTNWIDAFGGKWTYFTMYNTNRQNFYSKEEKSTAITHRIVGVNLPLFLENVNVYEEFFAIENTLYKLDSIDKSVAQKLKNPKLTRILELFTPNNYSKCLIQVDIENYNRQINEFNRQIKEFNDEIKSRNKTKKKDDKTREKLLSKFKRLQNQINGGRDKEEREEVTNDNINQSLIEFINHAVNIFEAYSESITQLKTDIELDLNKVYISKQALNILINNNVNNTYRKNFEELLGSKGKERHNLKLFTSLASIQKAENLLINDENKNIVIKSSTEKINHHSFLMSNYFDFIENEAKDCNLAKELLKVLVIDKEFKKDRIVDKESSLTMLNIVKDYAEKANKLSQLYRYFAVLKKNEITDFPNGEEDMFYGDYHDTILGKAEEGFEKDKVFEYYNQLRNFLTKVEINKENFKLIFNKPTIFTGWSDNNKGNYQYYSTILKKDGKFYVCVLTKASLLNNKALDEVDSTKNNYEILKVKMIKSNSLYGSSYLGKYGNKFKDDQSILPESILIKRLLEILKTKEKSFPILKPMGSDFTTLLELSNKLKALEEHFFTMSFEPTSSILVKNLEIENKILLFELYSKDIYGTTKNAVANNLQSIYFNNLFSNENFSKPKIKLGAGAKILFQDLTSKEKLVPKKDKFGNIQKYSKIGKPSRNTHDNYDNANKIIYEKERYLIPRYYFHFPVVLNLNTKENYINSKTKKPLSNKFHADHLYSLIKETGLENYTILSLDRGEKHLLYYTLISNKGAILEQGSLNEIEGVPYFQKLVQRENDRIKARLDWTPIEKIKDLKKGFVSAAVHFIAKKAIENQAFIIMEDLNQGFKRGRQKIERQVYQQFELALAKKLNFYVDKKASSETIGHISKAIQLTPPINNYQDIGKHCGILFYINPAWTSITDPITRFNRRLFNNAQIPKSGESLKSMKEWIQNNPFEIEYENEHFTFEFGDKLKNVKLHSCVDRYTYNRNFDRTKEENDSNKRINQIEVTKNLDILFPDKTNLQEFLFHQEHGLEFYEKLFFNINMILQLRNNDGTIDFIQSPVYPFFDSRRPKKFGKLLDNDNYDVPENGDSNGAYNIGIKGIQTIEKLKYEIQNKEDITKINFFEDCYVTLEDFDNWSFNQ